MTYSSEVLADSPLVYWRLGESSGTVAQDATANDRDGTIGASATLGVTGALGGSGDSDTAITTSGTSAGTVDRAYAAWMDVTNAVSMECWVKFTGTTTRYYWSRTGGTAVNCGLSTVSGTIRFHVNGVASTSVNSPLTYNDGNWHHVVGTYDGSTARIYVDGAEKATSTATTGNLDSTTNGLQVGGRGQDYFTGSVDEAAYYNTVLSAARVLAHYDAGTTTGGTTINGGLALETDTALAGSVTVGAVIAGSLATETDTALAGALIQGTSIPGGVALETDTALAGTVTVGAVIQGGLATETDTALAGTVIVPVRINGGLALETDTALAGSVYNDVIVEPAPVETDQDTVETDPVDQVAHEADWHPNVVVASPPFAMPQAWDVAKGFSAVNMTGPQPVYTVSEARSTRHRDRILIDGTDVTFYGGLRTPTPDFQLIEPLSYGVGTLRFLETQIHPLFTNLSSISWLRKGARVLVQRVDAADSVVATDYRGRVMAYDVSGPELTLDLGGLFSGPASVRDRPMPLVKRTEDVGYWTHAAFRRMRQPLDNDLDFGVDLISRGGMGQKYLDYVLEVCALAVNSDGKQLTIAYNETAKKWKQQSKDSTTVNATVYFDGKQYAPDLRRDFAEEVNEVYATAYLSDGTKLLNSAWPGMQQQTPIPTYPMAGGAAFGEGTTNAQTANGDGIDVLINRLVVLGYLRRDDQAGGFDFDVTLAVIDAQQDASRADVDPVGKVTTALWDWLWDLNATGYTTKEARVLPWAQNRAYREWNRSATGNLINRNPDYDASKAALTVSAYVNLGQVKSKSRARRFARTLLSGSETNWVGTLTLAGAGGSMALINGTHVPGTPIAAADVVPARAIRPGWNLWAPQFQGGTTFHVSGVDVSNDGAEVRLMLDTRARDTMQIAGILERNRENRTSPARAFWSQRSSSVGKDIIMGHDEHFGVLGHKVHLSGGEWNVFALPAGDYGTVARVKMFTEDDPAEFSMLVFGREVWAPWLAYRMSDPLGTVNAVGTVTVNVDTSKQATLTGPTAGAGNYVIRWGDGESTTSTSMSGRTHTYDSAGNYTIRVTGPGSYNATVTITVTNGSATGPFNGSANYLTKVDSDWWADASVRDDFEDRGLLYATGSATNPCGYWPGRKIDDAGVATGHTLTGKWRDDASFAFRAPEVVFWVAVYPDRACTVDAGEILYVQREEGA